MVIGYVNMKKLSLFIGVFLVVVMAFVFNFQEVINDVPVPPIDNPKLKPEPKTPAAPELDVPAVLRPVFEQARKENKKVLLFLTIDGCVYCEKMKRDVIPNTNLKNFVVFETKDVAVHDKYDAHSFPTFVILDKDASVIRRHTGYQGTALFQRWLDR